MNPSSRDAGIPLLTEIIGTPAENEESQGAAVQSQFEPDTASSSHELAWPETAEAPAAAPIPLPADGPAFESHALARLSEEDWKRLERRIRERILAQILAKTDVLLEQRIRDSLADALQLALEGLTSQLRDSLHEGLEDVITRAVAQEISRLQSTE